MLTGQAAEHDSLEDAVDAVSVRSLTKRTVSVTVPSESPLPDESEGTETHTTEAEPPSPAKSQAQRQSRRISDASNLDNVNLDGETADKPQGDRLSVMAPVSSPQAQVPTEPRSPADKEQPSKRLSLNSITGALPSMPWAPPAESSSRSPGPPMVAVASSQPPAAHPPPPTRKLTSPFSWLSRNASSNKDRDSSQSSPPKQSSWRNTASSVATLTSNPEMMLSRLEEENEDGANGSNRESLKDRFKALRMQEEVGTMTLERDGDKASDGLGRPHQGEEAPTSLPPPVPGSNDDLAPGTVSGIKAGPSAMQDARVDWDLWQSVVYEGPAAVARTSAEELNKAIATGIPHAIRGVIWQVLAQSNNEGLEAVYQDLVARGPDKHNDRHSNSTTASTISNGSSSTQSGDVVASSSSSVHSEQLGTNGSPSPRRTKAQRP